MRILLINSEYPPVGGGASNASANVAAIWAAAGHDVVVLTARYSSMPHDEIVNGVRVIRVRARRKWRDRSNPFEQVSFMFGAMFGAVRLVRQWRPEFVVAFFGVPSGPAGLLLRWIYGIPYIVSLRGGDVPGFRSYDFALYHKLISPVLHLVWRQAAAVVANSQGLRTLGRDFDNKVAIEIIPNGVESRQFANRGRQWSRPKLLTVGRVVYQKGIDIMFKALAALPDMDWDLMIVGDGSARPNLEKQAESLGLTDRVDFVGWQDKDGLVDYYRRANLFVYTSRDEGMSNAVLEAMAAGLPVVATRIAGNEELVLEGETGALVPSEDPEAVTAALMALIPDEAKREQMGAAGRERVNEFYTWEHTANQYLELMQTFLEKK